MGRVLRRAFGGLLVCSLLVTALAYYTYAPYLMLTVQTGPPAAEPAFSPTPRAMRSPTPTSGASPDAPDADLSADPGGRDPGIRLVATVDGRDRIFEVTETVRLPAPVTSLTLLPPDLRAAGGDLRSARPVATNVEVRVNGRTVRPRPKVQRKTTVVLRRATDRFEVSYRLTGAIRLNQPSWAGRAIGAVGPLVSRVPGDLPVAVSFRARRSAT